MRPPPTDAERQIRPLTDCAFPAGVSGGLTQPQLPAAQHTAIFATPAHQARPARGRQEPTYAAGTAASCPQSPNQPASTPNPRPRRHDRALGHGQLRTESVRVRSSLRLRFPCCLSRSGPWTSQQGRGCCRTDPLRPPPGPRECRRARSPADRRPPARPRLHRRPR